MASQNIAQELAEKTFKELASAKKPSQDSRNWQDPEGYRYLFPWSNLVLLRHFIRILTSQLPKSEYRRKAQLDDAGRSSVRNLEEGWKRPTTKEYLEFIGFSQASLEEVKGDVRELTDDGFLKTVPGASLEKIGVSLREFNLNLREGRGKLEEVKGLLEDNKGCYPPSSSNHPLTSSIKDVKGDLEDNKDKFLYHPLTVLYPPLKDIQASDLTYEIFMELINKTDYLLRNLVISLEEKLNRDQKYYQVDKGRLNLKAKGN